MALWFVLNPPRCRLIHQLVPAPVKFLATLCRGGGGAWKMRTFSGGLTGIIWKLSTKADIHHRFRGNASLVTLVPYGASPDPSGISQKHFTKLLVPNKHRKPHESPPNLCSTQSAIKCTRSHKLIHACSAISPHEGSHSLFQSHKSSSFAPHRRPENSSAAGRLGIEATLPLLYKVQASNMVKTRSSHPIRSHPSSA